MTSILKKRCIWKQRHTGSVACSNDGTQRNCVTAIQGMPNRASKPPEAGKWREGASHSFQKEHGPVDTLGFASQPSKLSNDVFLLLYLCVWCAVYMYMCTGMHSCLCAHSGAREECRLLCSISPHLIPWRQCLSQKPTPHSGKAGRPAGSQELPVSYSWMATAWLWSGDWRFKRGSLYLHSKCCYA